MKEPVTRSSLNSKKKQEKSAGNFERGRDSNASFKSPPVFQHRATFFGETSDALIKSTSKKKIYFLYDQFMNNKILKATYEQLENGLKVDPIAKILLGGAIMESSRSYLSSDCSFSQQSDDPEIPRDMDLLVSQLNTELLRIFMVHQLERCKD